MLTIDQIFSFEIAKFMFQFKSKKLPVIFDNYFNLINDASNYAKRSAIKKTISVFHSYKAKRSKIHHVFSQNSKKPTDLFLQENCNSI